MHAVVRDWRSAPLSPADRALCVMAAKLTATPAAMRPQDLDALRAHGFDDRAIHDAVQVVGYFNSMTRIAEALGVELESFIRKWGEESEGA